MTMDITVKKIIIIILIVLWLSVIYSFSTQDSNKSLNTSNTLIIKVAETIKGKKLTITEEEKIIKKYLFIVRKSAHFFLYFILGILVFILAKLFFDVSPKAIIYTIIFCFIYACSDEIHQYFVNGRTAKVFDVFIDTCGATCSTLISYIFIKFKRKCMLKK